MKRLSNLHVMALSLAFMVFAGTSVFAADSGGDRSNALNENGPLLSAQDFKALADIPAAAMNEAELEEVQGKYIPPISCLRWGCRIPVWLPKVPDWRDPLCWVDGCGGPGPLDYLSYFKFNPQPDPPKDLGGKNLGGGILFSGQM